MAQSMLVWQREMRGVEVNLAVQGRRGQVTSQDVNHFTDERDDSDNDDGLRYSRQLHANHGKDDCTKVQSNGQMERKWP